MPGKSHRNLAHFSPEEIMFSSVDTLFDKRSFIFNITTKKTFVNISFFCFFFTEIQHFSSPFLYKTTLLIITLNYSYNNGSANNLSPFIYIVGPRRVVGKKGTLDKSSGPIC